MSGIKNLIPEFYSEHLALRFVHQSWGSAQINIFKKFLLTSTIVFVTITSSYSQPLSNISTIKTHSNILKQTGNNNSPVSINTSFAYMFLGNNWFNYTNSKGFSLDLQLDQKNYTSWLVGGNFNFYKSYYVRDTLNLSFVNLYLGPKFYFSKDDLSTYCIINVGITLFGGRNPEALTNAFSLFPAVGAEYKISKNFKITLEPNINIFLFGSFYGSFGYFGIKTGINTNFN